MLFSFVCFQSPEGRRQNSPGFQPWERDAQRNRPERASELELVGNEEYVATIFDGSVSFAPNCVRCLPHEVPSSCCRKALSLEITLGGRPPFQGDSLSVRLPRAEAPTPQSDSTELAEVLRRGMRFQDTGAPKRSEGGLGCFVFALRAMAECSNSRGRCFQHPETRELRTTPLQKSYTIANPEGAVLATPGGVWTFACACSNRPKGEQRIAQAAFATLRRACSLRSVQPSEPAATKDFGELSRVALRSRAFRPGTHQ